jgi:hypothetical protein
MRIKPVYSMIVAAAMIASCATRASYTDLYGQPAPPSAAQHTIVIHPHTRYVNVEGGQVVKFVAGDKEFTWDFYVAKTVSNFELNDVAPAGMLNHMVHVYVSPDPKYIGYGEPGI